MWFLFGFIVGIGLLALALWLRNRKITIKWYEWLIGIIGLGLLLFMIQNIIGSVREMEIPPPAYLFLINIFLIIIISFQR